MKNHYLIFLLVFLFFISFVYALECPTGTHLTTFNGENKCLVECHGGDDVPAFSCGTQGYTVCFDYDDDNIKELIIGRCTDDLMQCLNFTEIDEADISEPLKLLTKYGILKKAFEDRDNAACRCPNGFHLVTYGEKTRCLPKCPGDDVPAFRCGTQGYTVCFDYDNDDIKELIIGKCTDETKRCLSYEEIHNDITINPEVKRKIVANIFFKAFNDINDAACVPNQIQSGTEDSQTTQGGTEGSTTTQSGTGDSQTTQGGTEGNTTTQTGTADDTGKQQPDIPQSSVPLEDRMLLTPEYGSDLTINTVFSWKEIPDATNYYIILSDPNMIEMSSPISNNYAITKESYESNFLPKKGWWDWYIVGYDDQGKSVGNTELSLFKVTAAEQISTAGALEPGSIAQIPTITSPKDKDGYFDVGFKFEWSEVTDPKYPNVFYAMTLNMPGIGWIPPFKITNPVTIKNLDVFKRFTKYPGYWKFKVIALAGKDTNGDWVKSEWSDEKEFYVGDNHCPPGKEASGSECIEKGPPCTTTANEFHEVLSSDGKSCICEPGYVKKFGKCYEESQTQTTEFQEQTQQKGDLKITAVPLDGDFLRGFAVDESGVYTLEEEGCSTCNSPTYSYTYSRILMSGVYHPVWIVKRDANAKFVKRSAQFIESQERGFKIDGNNLYVHWPYSFTSFNKDSLQAGNTFFHTSSAKSYSANQAFFVDGKKYYMSGGSQAGNWALLVTQNFNPGQKVAEGCNQRNRDDLLQIEKVTKDNSYFMVLSKSKLSFIDASIDVNTLGHIVSDDTNNIFECGKVNPKISLVSQYDFGYNITYDVVLSDDKNTAYVAVAKGASNVISQIDISDINNPTLIKDIPVEKPIWTASNLDDDKKLIVVNEYGLFYIKAGATSSDSFSLVKLDANTGEVIWEQELQAKVKSLASSGNNMYAYEAYPAKYIYVIKNFQSGTPIE